MTKEEKMQKEKPRFSFAEMVEMSKPVSKKDIETTVKKVSNFQELTGKEFNVKNYSENIPEFKEFHRAAMHRQNRYKYLVRKYVSVKIGKELPKIPIYSDLSEIILPEHWEKIPANEQIKVIQLEKYKKQCFETLQKTVK